MPIRTHFNTLIEVLTGYCIIGRHAERFGITANDFCCSCGDEEGEESLLADMKNLILRKEDLKDIFITHNTDKNSVVPRR